MILVNSDIMEEELVNLLFCNRGWVFRNILQILWLERNMRIFRGVESSSLGVRLIPIPCFKGSCPTFVVHTLYLSDSLAKGES